MNPNAKNTTLKKYAWKKTTALYSCSFILAEWVKLRTTGLGRNTAFLTNTTGLSKFVTSDTLKCNGLFIAVGLCMGLGLHLYIKPDSWVLTALGGSVANSSLRKEDLTAIHKVIF